MVVQHLNPYILISISRSRAAAMMNLSMSASQDWEFGGDKFPSRFQDRIWILIHEKDKSCVIFFKDCFFWLDQVGFRKEVH